MEENKGLSDDIFQIENLINQLFCTVLYTVLYIHNIFHSLIVYISYIHSSIHVLIYLHEVWWIRIPSSGSLKEEDKQNNHFLCCQIKFKTFLLF